MHQVLPDADRGLTRTEVDRALQSAQFSYSNSRSPQPSRSKKMLFNFSCGIKNETKNIRFFLMVLIGLVVSINQANASDDIPPPFGFRWNESSSRVEQVLVGAKAKIVSKEKKEKRDVWTVEGLVQPGLKRTIFGFREGFLIEVELQYRISGMDHRTLQRTDGRNPPIL